MAKYQILYWHDIPLQVRARDEGGRAGKPLSPRFLEAVDQAAMKAGITGQDAYTSGFHWTDPEERAGKAAEVAEQVAAEIEASLPKVNWRQTVAKISGD